MMENSNNQLYLEIGKINGILDGLKGTVVRIESKITDLEKEMGELKDQLKNQKGLGSNLTKDEVETIFTFMTAWDSIGNLFLKDLEERGLLPDDIKHTETET